MKTLISLFLLLSFPAFAQKKVSQVCADKIPLYDSAMKVQYGAAIFPYFKIDTTSYVITAARRRKSWNDTLTGDSVRYYDIRYTLTFPGAKQSYSGYRPEQGDNGLPSTARPSYPAYCSTVIDSASMNRITKKHLKKPLNKCEVSPCKIKDLSDIKLPKGYKLDSTHIYLDVEFITRTVTTKENYTMEIKKFHYIIVDACTGDVLDKPRLLKTRWITFNSTSQ